MTAISSVCDGGKRERVFVCVAAVLLVLFRSVVPTVFEGFHFDSDQAIVGLMAKHLSEFTRFPLFFYGQNYMLGVESWIVAPLFWIVRPSVAALRAPFILLNALVAVWLVIGLNRGLRIRPAFAFVAVLPFIMPAPLAADRLIETLGACVEPFVYVLLLWRFRARPVAVGALFALAFLHRELTLVAIPALVVTEASVTDRLSRASVRRLALMALSFGLVWLAVDDLNLHMSGTSLGLQASSLGRQACFAQAAWTPRAVSVVTEALPALVGGASGSLRDFGLNTPLSAGRPIVWWGVVILLAGMVGRLFKYRQGDRPFDEGQRFPIYLAMVGLFTACAYPLSCSVTPGAPPLLRYLLLALLIPIGVFALFIRREQSRAWQALAVGSFVLWAAMNFLDNANVLRAAMVAPPQSEHRVLADYLVSQHIRYARATYWDAYVVTFLSRERVIVASDIVRIPDYQQQVDEHAGSAVTLQRLPCDRGERVASWCVQTR